MTSSHRDLEPDGTGVRTAVLVGFPRGLEDALSVLLRSRQFAVRITPSASKATELIQTAHVDLVVASSRCPPSSILELTEALGKPRRARVIVLIAGHDLESEQRYRAAGLKYVLTMPVSAEDLLRAGS